MKVTQSCPTLCYPMDYTVRGILHSRILEWVTVPFSRGSSQPRDWTQISHTAGGFFTSWATREVPKVEILFAYKDRRVKIVTLEMFKLKIYFCLVPVEILTQILFLKQGERKRICNQNLDNLALSFINEYATNDTF